MYIDACIYVVTYVCVYWVSLYSHMHIYVCENGFIICVSNKYLSEVYYCLNLFSYNRYKEIRIHLILAFEETRHLLAKWKASSLSGCHPEWSRPMQPSGGALSS